MGIAGNIKLVSDNSENPLFRKIPSRGFEFTLHNNFNLQALPNPAPDYTLPYIGWAAELFASDLNGCFTLADDDTFDFSGFKGENPFTGPHL